MNLKILQIGRTVNITDSNITEILAHNPLQNLELFSIKGSETTALTILSVESLLLSCQNLTELTDLRCWAGVYPREVEELEVRAIRQNWNVVFGKDTENISEDALRRAGLKEKFDRLREQFGEATEILK